MFSDLYRRLRQSEPTAWELEENLKAMNRQAPDPTRYSYLLGLSLGQGVQPSAFAVVEKLILGMPSSGGPTWSKAPGRYEVRYLKRWAPNTPQDSIIDELRRYMRQPELARADALVEAGNSIKAVRMAIRQSYVPGAIRPSIIVENIGEGWNANDGLWKISLPSLVETVRQLILSKRLKFSRPVPNPPYAIPSPEEIAQTFIAYQISDKPVSNEVFAARRDGERDDVVYAVGMPVWWGQYCERTLAIG